MDYRTTDRHTTIKGGPPFTSNCPSPLSPQPASHRTQRTKSIDSNACTLNQLLCSSCTPLEYQTKDSRRLAVVDTGTWNLN